MGVMVWKGILWWMVWLCAGLAGWMPAHAQPEPSPIVLLQNLHAEQPVGLGIAYLEDPDGRLSVHELLKQPQDWAINLDRVFNQSYNDSTWWLRFDVRNQTSLRDWLMEITYPVLDHLDIYVIRGQRLTQHFRLGDKQPFAERPVDHRSFLVPLQLDADAQILIRVRSSSSVQVPILFWEESYFHAAETDRAALQGIYYGALLIIAVYNLLLYLALRDHAYVYYVAYVICLGLFTAGLDGWAFQYLWPEQTHWNDQAILFFLAGLLFFASAFSRLFLDTPSISWFADAGQKLWLILSVSIIIASFYFPYNVMIKLLVPLAALICAFDLSLGIYAWLKGYPAARYYTLAWAMLMVGGFVLALTKFHILPRNLFTDSATQIGSLLEAALLSFALAERINQERAMRHQAQQQALDTQFRATEALEQRVAERTRELEIANRKLHELSATDALTGIKNRGHLDRYLQQEVSRAVRYQHPLTVILIDVDHFKTVNDTHGHLVGDDCLREVARRIAVESRWPSDLAARYGGEEFCMVLPETDAEGARSVAERIRQQVESAAINTPIGPLQLTVSLGVFNGTPTQEDDAARFLAEADAALYQSKNQGRNQVTLKIQAPPEPSANLCEVSA